MSLFSVKYKDTEILIQAKTREEAISTAKNVVEYKKGIKIDLDKEEDEIVKELRKTKGFTTHQIELMDELLVNGSGASSFARNVRQQGWCSPKQEIAMEKMVRDFNNKKNTYRDLLRREYSSRISDPPLIYEKGSIRGYAFGMAGGNVFYDSNGEETCPPSGWEDDAQDNRFSVN